MQILSILYSSLFQPFVNQSLELISEVKEVRNLKDAWYNSEVNADLGEMRYHILPLSTMKNKNNLKQQKGDIALTLFLQ